MNIDAEKGRVRGLSLFACLAKNGIIVALAQKRFAENSHFLANMACPFEKSLL
ncbi:hypothetical protein JQM63_11030 [Oscillibacter valericigenes]|nr:hypothetical protein [Oscillibacter valericigenes]